MFPYLMGPTSTNEKFWYGLHIVMHPSRITETIGFLTIDSGIDQTNKNMIDHFFTLLRDLKPALTIKNTFGHRSIFRPIRHYTTSFESNVYSYNRKENQSDPNIIVPEGKAHKHKNRQTIYLLSEYRKWLKKQPPRDKKSKLRSSLRLRR